MEGLHAAQHLLLAATALLIPHDSGDINTEHAYRYQSRARPNHLVIFDSRPGGTGVAEAAYASGMQIVRLALALVEGCQCDGGCPACVHSPRCPEHNDVISKHAGSLLLQSIVNGFDVAGKSDTEARDLEESNDAGAGEADAAVVDDSGGSPCGPVTRKGGGWIHDGSWLEYIEDLDTSKTKECMRY